MYKAIDFLGIKVSAITKEEVVDKILEFAFSDRHRIITYIDAHCVNISFADPEYREILKQTDLVCAGGKGVVWASKLFTHLLPERVNSLDFFDRLVEGLIEKKVKIYLLGGRQDVVKKTEEILKERGIGVIGSRSGFFDRNEETEIIQEINALRPDILIVGMGVPKQEKWIYGHLDELNTNLAWAVGAAFDYLSGYRKRAPRWMINWGVEWLYRLCQEPKKLWKRYLFGNPLFIYRVLKCRF